jgi:predicted ATPase
MRQLSVGLDAVAESGTGLAICVRGEPGIGKTRLIEELRSESIARGYACHTGHVLDFGVRKGQDAISMVLSGLLQVAAPGDESARRAAVERGLRDGLIGPEHEVFINDLLDLAQPSELQAIFDAMDNAMRTQRAGEAVTSVLERAAARQPRLIVMEDVHWASAALLRHFAQLTLAAAEVPMVLVMTSRIEGDPLDKFWRASTRGSPLITIDLGPLRPEEARLLAELEAERIAEEKARQKRRELEDRLANARGKKRQTSTNAISERVGSGDQAETVKAVKDSTSSLF